MTGRHNIMRNLLASSMFQPAGLSHRIEVPLLVPGTNPRAAYILVQTAPSPTDTLDELRQIAYDVTIRSPFTTNSLARTAKETEGAAEAAHKDKLSSFIMSIRSAFGLADNAPIPDLDFTFALLAFDTLGVPSTFTAAVIHSHARLISERFFSTPARVLEQLRQRTSFAIWSSVASATQARIPMLGNELHLPAI